ncbi:hypothetical protein PUMCH_001716 [Australozyma saopauloensis]|uniref:Uncharacterized protein n=1 Tax=Australozyma saopauloensis TaxID=291208 RepID=A0AAX4H7J9_9ASCO|nr:hypothetical protein PUMCH_001716 [[Candida] saopauloensis]
MPLPYKVVLLGDSSVGKTSLVHRFIADAFNPHLANTIGAAFISKDYTHNERTVKFEIWDTAGQERYKSLTPMYYRNALVALVCFDLGVPEASFERAKYWIEQLLTLGPADIKIRVVGNKMDLELEEAGLLLLIEEFCRERQLAVLKTSAKRGEGVGELFDSIVLEIPQAEFDSYSLEQAQEGQTDDALLLNLRNRRTGCC